MKVRGLLICGNPPRAPSQVHCSHCTVAPPGHNSVDALFGHLLRGAMAANPGDAEAVIKTLIRRIADECVLQHGKAVNVALVAFMVRHGGARVWLPSRAGSVAKWARLPWRSPRLPLSAPRLSSGQGRCAGPVERV